MSEHTAGKIIRNNLVAKQVWQLTQFCQKGYLQTGKPDAEFAKLAEAELGFTITGHNVRGCLETLEIPSINSRPVKGGGMVELADLRRRLERLEQRVEVYFAGCTNGKGNGHASA